MPERKKKVALDGAELRVESFETTRIPEGVRGTVEAHGNCTRRDTCACHTSLYVCGTYPPTRSCDYTAFC
jgi:hypothetical protein